MAKPQQQKRKARPSWFQKQIERDGEQFMLRKQPLDIQKEAFNIIRDIMRGNITQKDLKYLFNPNILSNVKIAVYDKYLEYHTYNSAITLAFQIPNGIQMLTNNYSVDETILQKVYNNTKNQVQAYVIILQSLDSMIAAVQAPYQSEDQRQQTYLQVYSSVQYQLSRFKFII